MSDYDIIYRLTTQTPTHIEKGRMLRDFSRNLGWEPSDIIEPEKDIRHITNGHLIVEHGIEQSAVITFLNNSSYFSLKPQENIDILSISYNNLIDWHIFIDANNAFYVYNREYTYIPIRKDISPANIENIKSSLFEQITNVDKNPNFPALDESLISTISYWKRYIAAELPENSSILHNISMLFNGLFFVRALEDFNRKTRNIDNNMLTAEWKKLKLSNENPTLEKIITTSLSSLSSEKLPKSLIDVEKLNIFNSLKPDFIYELLSSFYKNTNIPYPYDFAIMSKHALSRIYEHYVSILHYEEDDTRLYFIPPLPEEKFKKTYGTIYTPEFIAKFFSRFLREKIPPALFRNLKIFDPACGSGIFLRTMIEFQFSSAIEGLSTDEIERIFNNVYGIDIDDNAVLSTKLSLSLLYLIMMGGKYPNDLHIETHDTVDYILNNDYSNYYDIVMANPPFIKFESQHKKLKENIKNLLSEFALNKPDAYLAFLKIAIDVLKPGGFGLFVLPHSFLKNVSAQKIRSYIYKNAWINCMIDLSSVPVFKDSSIYIILFIFQKKKEDIDFIGKRTTSIIICQDFIGKALHDFLNGVRVEETYYSIFDINHKEFEKVDWSKPLISPSYYNILKKIEKNVPLKDIFNVRQGIVSGGDDVYIINKDSIPDSENDIWKPFIKDRQIKRYDFPRKYTHIIFYPKIDNKIIDENILKKSFPKTWEHLLKNKNKLSVRKQQEDQWWLPTSLRNPNELFIPKIITPHLMLIPKFSLDKNGIYAISRSPYIYNKEETFDDQLLFYLLGILNSTIGAWLLSTYSDKYNSGYSRLEVKTLKMIPIPNPSKINYPLFMQIIKLVRKKFEEKTNLSIENKIENCVANIYELNKSERQLLGVE